MELSQFASDYLSLGLRINKHIDGYVEHYYGPPEIKERINSESPKSPKKLLEDCFTLINRLPDQGYEARRKKFLLKTLEAIGTIIRVLNGEKFQYLELIENLYDFKPILYEDDFFYNLASKANDLYKGNGNLATRINQYANERATPKTNIKDSFFKTLSIAQQRTKEVFPNLLPEKEKVTVNETTNQSWELYCWYQGDYKSIVEINIDRMQFWTSMLFIACHEAYPGHHTERCVREKFLFRNKEYYECSILLIYTPEMVISEGLGIVAEDVLFNPVERAEILLYNVNPNSKEDTVDLNTFIGQDEIRKGFRRFDSNIAYHKYVHNWSDKELIKYMKSLELITDRVIEGIMRFISDELWAPYSQTYQGERLITEKFGVRPQPVQFRELLSNQTLPSDLL